MAAIEEEEKKQMEAVGDATAVTPVSSQTPLRFSLLLLLNTALVVVGTGGPLLLRLYFIRGGKRRWLSSLLQIWGWPLLLLPLSLSYLRRRRSRPRRPARPVLLTPALAATSAGIGLVIGIDSYLYSLGSSYLPLSTSALLVSTQLAFTAVFALLIVRQRFTPYSVNSVVLLTLGPVVLSLHAGGDRPAGETGAQYGLGFVMTVAAAALIGAALPLVELTCRRSKEAVTYELVMEMQLVMGLAGTVLCLVGAAVNRDLQAIPREAKEFDLGEAKYYVVLVLDTIFWQLLNVGVIGLISCASSLLAGILVAVLLPISELLSVIFFHEKFDGGKGVALALSLWGFVSYLYGEMKHNRKLKKTEEVEATSIIIA